MWAQGERQSLRGLVRRSGSIARFGKRSAAYDPQGVRQFVRAAGTSSSVRRCGKTTAIANSGLNFPLSKQFGGSTAVSAHA
jgi:hypothetical protein